MNNTISSASVFVNGILCPTNVMTDTLLACTSPQGLGGNLSIDIITSNFFSNPKNTYFSYKLPVVKSVSPFRLPVATTSVDPVTTTTFIIMGENFGFLNQAGSIQVKFINAKNISTWITAQGLVFLNSNQLTVDFATTKSLLSPNITYRIVVVVAGQSSIQTNVTYSNFQVQLVPVTSNLNFPQTVSEQSSIVLQLNATDLWNDALSLFITKLPVNGSLYQYVIGASSQGNLINLNEQVKIIKFILN